jgi:hypothetical protein
MNVQDNLTLKACATSTHHGGDNHMLGIGQTVPVAQQDVHILHALCVCAHFQVDNTIYTSLNILYKMEWMPTK